MLKIEKETDLSSLNTLGIGGKARFFCKVSLPEDLEKATNYAKERNLPFFVLGGGSNVFFPEEGFPGLVIKIDIHGIGFEEKSEDVVLAEAGAGENWDQFVKKTVERNLYGLENLSGIPGSVGGAPVQNIGAYGVELKNSFYFVEVFDAQKAKVRRLYASQCQFGYRDSIFKKSFGKHLLIIKAVFRLRKKGLLVTNYKDVSRFIEENGIENITPVKMREIILCIRKEKFPSLKEVGTAGSFFKNPIISEGEYKKLLEKYPQLPGFTLSDNRMKIPLAWILDNLCGLKGYKIGNIGLYDRQPLVLVNYGRGTYSEVKDLVRKVSDRVFEKTGIRVENEVTFVDEAGNKKQNL